LKTAFTIEDVLKSACGGLNPHLQAEPKAKWSKYNNVKVEFDGYVFDSIKERARYIELRALQAAGEITDLLLQIPFELNEGGKYSLKYVADFTYWINGQYIVEDVKGFRTAVYKKKKALMLKVHGIEIKEI
jgi:hypothetical protein